MPTNVTPQYKKAEQEYLQARTTQERLDALKRMLSLAPGHKGAEYLRANIKTRIARLKEILEKERKQVKKRGKGIFIKKEGAAQVVLVGVTNSGKSTLLSRVTNAKPEIADYEFTTREPVVGSMDYNGVIIQVVEMPAITKDFLEKENGAAYMGIIRQADLIVIVSRSKEDEELVKEELEKADVDFRGIVVSSYDEDVKERIWNALGLIYVYTKSPGKEKDYPPVALKKGSSVRDLAEKVHKDFINKFDYARVWGKSVKYDGMRVGLTHVLEEGDVVELHLK
jgi:hypothetical protein